MFNLLTDNWVLVVGAGSLLLSAAALFYAAVLFRRAEKSIRHVEEAAVRYLSKALEAESSPAELTRQDAIVTVNEEYARVVERVAAFGRETLADAGRELDGKVDDLIKRWSEERFDERARVESQVADIGSRAIDQIGYELEKLTYREGQQLRARSERLIQELLVSLSSDIRQEIDNVRRTILRGYTIPAEIVIAGIAAALQAVQTWISFRDRARAARVFDETFAQRRDSPSTREQAETLITLVPPEVLSTMERRTRSCWEKYHAVLKDEKEFLPEEVDNATEALKRCICRELNRIRKLNRDVLPEGDLSNWWSFYCKISNA